MVRESGRSLQLTSLDPETEQEVKTGVWGAWSVKRPLWRKDDWTQDGGCGHLGGPMTQVPWRYRPQRSSHIGGLTGTTAKKQMT